MAKSVFIKAKLRTKNPSRNLPAALTRDSPPMTLTGALFGPPGSAMRQISPLSSSAPPPPVIAVDRVGTSAARAIHRLASERRTTAKYVNKYKVRWAKHSLSLLGCWERQAGPCHLRPAVDPAHLLTGTQRARTACLWPRKGPLACVRLRVCSFCSTQWPSGTPQLSGGSFHCREMEGVGSHTAYVESVAEWTHRPRGPRTLKAWGLGASLSPAM